MPPVLIIDGDCGFCRLVSRRMQDYLRLAGDIVPWSESTGKALGVSRGEAETSVWLVGPEGKLGGAAAVAAWMRTGRRVSRYAGAAIGSRPMRPLSERAYRWIAAHRSRLPGSTCGVDLDRRA